jgi:putative oxidoreductase
MPKFMHRFDRETYALMRIVVGFLFFWHGVQKLFGYPPGMPAGIPAFVTYVGGPIEFFGGLFVMLGLFTRWAAFIASGMMAVAYWMGHGWRAPLPIVNQGELAVLYCFVFLHIAARGPGIWSVDGARGA